MIITQNETHPLIEKGYLVPSVVDANKWFLFLDGGFEVEILKTSKKNKVTVAFSHKLHWKTQKRIVGLILEEHEFAIYKEEWKELSHSGSGIDRMAS